MVVIFSLLSPNVTAILYIQYTPGTGRMAQLQTINFDWWRDPKGYRIVREKPWGHRIVRKGHPREKLELCRPLDPTDSLFRVFANIGTAPKGLLDFVNRHGPLTLTGNDQGDPVGHVAWHARVMQDLLKSVSADRQQTSLAEKFNGAPAVTFDAMVVWDPVAKAAKWELRPRSLLDGLWLQFGQAVTRGANIRTCAHCGAWFETGAGTGRRLDSKFCSDEHRIAFNSLKRSKEK